MHICNVRVNNNGDDDDDYNNDHNNNTLSIRNRVSNMDCQREHHCHIIYIYEPNSLLENSKLQYDIELSVTIDRTQLYLIRPSKKHTQWI
jgi:hypothetical protein